jgi:hypothetical protein
MSTTTRQRVRMDEIGLYLKTIELDYRPKDNEERANLITEHFPVLCLEEDIEQYEEMTYYNNQILNEDWETTSRRESYAQQQGLSNPFY